MPKTAKTFGRRNLPSETQVPARFAAASPRLPVALPESGKKPNIEAAALFAAALAAERQAAEAGGSHGSRMVPKSVRAALLAGLVVALLHTSLDLGTIIALGQQSGTVSVGGHTMPMGPMLLIDGLLSGARWSTIGLLSVRALLTQLERTGFGAYALCGGGVALLYALLMQTLGWGDQVADLPMDIGTGAAAGFFYRLFAGTKPV